MICYSLRKCRLFSFSKRVQHMESLENTASCGTSAVSQKEIQFYCLCQWKKIYYEISDYVIKPFTMLQCLYYLSTIGHVKKINYTIIY